MSRVSLLQLSRKTKRFGLKLRGNSAGTAAIEFGLIAPILLLMLMGVIELSRAISIDRKFGMVTSTIADIVAREKTITAADVTAMYTIVDHLMKPWSASTLKLAIVPVKSSPTNGADTKVYAGTINRPTLHGASQKAKCSTYSLSANMLAPATSVIVVEATYLFTPLFSSSIIGSSTWTDKAILSPRNSCVDFDAPSNCVSGCWNGG